jgi:hypothetical protein
VAAEVVLEADTAVAAHHTDAVDTVAATAAALHEEVATVVDTAAEEADQHTAHTRCGTNLAHYIPRDFGRLLHHYWVLRQGRRGTHKIGWESGWNL